MTMRIHYDTLEQMIVDTAETVRPPERITVSEAAEKYRKINNPGSYVGPWRNSKTPYLVEPMDLLSSTMFTAMIFVGPAQCGKTDMLMNWLTHTAICDPADVTIVEKSQASARDFSKRRVDRLFRHSPEVGNKVIPGKQNQNIFDTRFKSGMFLTLSWPTINELSGKPIPRLWLTDYDRMDEDVDGEGSPFDLAQKRTTTFREFGMTVAESSPGVTVDDPRWISRTPHEAPPARKILSLYNRGDKRRWYWQCGGCLEWFEPSFRNLTWPQNVPKEVAAASVTMSCPHCGTVIEPNEKNALNQAGRWVPDGMRLDTEGNLLGTPPKSETASFWLKGPAASFIDWKDLVLKYLTAWEEFESTGSEEALKTTVNTDQGEPYVPQRSGGERLPEDLKSRAENWGGNKVAPVVPLGVRFLVATVDVQGGTKKRFVVQVHGFGVGGDCWIVDTFRIDRSARLNAMNEREWIDPAAYPEDWDQITTQVVEKLYPLGDGSGRMMPVKLTAVDSGGEAGVTTNAYNYWRRLKDGPHGHHRRLRLIKGDPNKSAPRFRETFPDSNRKDRHAGARGDVPVIFVGSRLMKDQAWARLGRTEPGEGMVHFPDWAEDWLYTQLTAEVRTPKGWENPRRYRNEAWDLLVYAMTATLHPGIRIELIDWDNPPGWAEEWDANDLVIAADAENPFAHEAPKKYDPKKLAAILA